MGLMNSDIAKPVMIGLGALLLNKMLSHSGNPAEASAVQPNTASANPDGGLIGGLGGLLDKLQSAGHGETVNSWVGNGPNQPIDPGHLGSALGQGTVKQAAEQAGIDEQQLLSQLSNILPGIVNQLTTNGRLPTLQELAAAFTQQEQQQQQPQK